MFQDRNIHILDGTTVENKGKLILAYITKSIYLGKGNKQHNKLLGINHNKKPTKESNRSRNLITNQPATHLQSTTGRDIHSNKN
jgi:hypothetical protein